MLARTGFNLLQVLVVLAFAPLVEGVVSRLKEILQSKRGPSIVQPYRDIWKLLHKDEIVSDHSLLSPGTSEDDVEAVSRHFRTAIVRRDQVIDVVDDLAVAPPVSALRRLAGLIRRAHVGHVNAYATYVLVALLVVLIVGMAVR